MFFYNNKLRNNYLNYNDLYINYYYIVFVSVCVIKYEYTFFGKGSHIVHEYLHMNIPKS